MKEIEQAIQNLDRRLRQLSVREPRLQAWQPVTLLSGWSPLSTVSYWKDPHGLVHLRGRVTGGTPPSTAFVLPANYRPEQLAQFAVAGGVVQVDSGGAVDILSGTTIAFDGVLLRAKE